MVTQAQIDFLQAASELSLLTRRDPIQGLKLAKYKKLAQSMLPREPACGYTLLGQVACYEHDLASMQLFHKKAIEVSSSCFSLIYFAVSLERSCLWAEAERYALLALDHDPGNLKILDTIIRMTPLTGRFALLKQLLAQWHLASSHTPHPLEGDDQVLVQMLAEHGLTEKDLKPVLAAMGETLSGTNAVITDFRYQVVRPESGLTAAKFPPFVHFRFRIPDEFVATWYEDLLDARVAGLECHPRLWDAFSFSVENGAMYELYRHMDAELEAGADVIAVPDPEKMKLIEELVAGVEV